MIIVRKPDGIGQGIEDLVSAADIEGEVFMVGVAGQVSDTADIQEQVILIEEELVGDGRHGSTLAPEGDIGATEIGDGGDAGGGGDGCAVADLGGKLFVGEVEDGMAVGGNDIRKEIRVFGTKVINGVADPVAEVGMCFSEITGGGIG